MVAELEKAQREKRQGEGFSSFLSCTSPLYPTPPSTIQPIGYACPVPPCLPLRLCPLHSCSVFNDEEQWRTPRKELTSAEGRGGSGRGAEGGGGSGEREHCACGAATSLLLHLWCW